jgi:hypothetical protein
MTLLPNSLRGYLWRFSAIGAAYLILFEIVARTNVMPRVMTLNFAEWELALIVLFLAARFLVYLVLIPAVVSLVVYQVVRYLLNLGKRSTSPR